MPAGDSMPDTYIAIMLQSLKKKEQVLDEIIRLDDRQKDTLTDPECPFDVFVPLVLGYHCLPRHRMIL